MNRFFDYSRELLDYFDWVDRRYGGVGADAEPAAIAEELRGLDGIKAVMWDLYGTLLKIDIGDLEGSLEEQRHITRAAAAVVEEFELGSALERMVHDSGSEMTAVELLCRYYTEAIADSHERSKKKGVAYPEVVIERIWAQILTICYGVVAGKGEIIAGDGKKISETALRCGYLFDSAMQRTSFNLHAGECLGRLADKGVVQGIISNAQFYTPLHIRRLAREAGLGDDPFNTIFTMGLVFFSYELGYSKPNPGAFDLANTELAKMGIGPNEVVYVGNDMLNDVWAAKQAGWRTILYGGQKEQTRLRQDDERCKDLKADRTVLDLADAAKVITGEAD
ncbi:MAG: HAD family hydrolase [Sedimentisphaerales bacterium]|nr:HAD family hydrolase [Sedimentisphaerales bacterium]